jgi:hypothetical protein
MASAGELTRSLTIKTKMLQRLLKEYAYYQQEADKEHARVEGMKGAGADAHDLRQAVRRVLLLCRGGVPRCHALAAAGCVARRRLCQRLQHMPARLLPA